MPLLLFVLSAAFVAWRNSEVGVLVDLSYILNIGMRIAEGQAPYKDFALAQAPGTFLIQAGLIRLFGPLYPVQIAYASLAGGLATALTYAIVRRLLTGAVERPRLLAAVLTLPLVTIGIYAIFPHPFYDSDACLASLFAILAVLWARERPTPGRWLLAAVLLTLPVWLKQNIGGAFLIAALGCLAAEAVARPDTRRRFAWCVGGVAVAIGAELALLQAFVGIDRYLAWTWSFAMTGRGVALSRFAEFADPRVLWPGALLLGLGLAAQRVPRSWRPALFVASLALPLALLAAVPWLFQRVTELVPPIGLCAVAFAVARAARDGARFDTLLPVVALATIAGALQSQGLVSSSFGIFPLVIVSLAALVRDLSRFVDRGQTAIAPRVGLVFAIVLAIGGSLATLSNQRLLFVDVNGPGPVHHSTYPSLAGLSARGPYLAELDAVLVWIRDNVPAGDPMVFLPGEDPTFFALGRAPRLPVVYFFDVANPYSPAELARIADDVGLRWVFVKHRLQLAEEPPLNAAIAARLTHGATLVGDAGAYRIYRR